MLEGAIKASGGEFWARVLLHCGFLILHDRSTGQGVSDGAKIAEVVMVATNFLVGLEVHTPHWEAHTRYRELRKPCGQGGHSVPWKNHCW